MIDRELQRCLDHAAEGLHWVGPDGTIQWANQTELDLLGYAREEYVGHNVAEFHVDPFVIEDILARLTRGETLLAYEARLRHRDGSIRYVQINSNVLRRRRVPADAMFHARRHGDDGRDRRSDALRSEQPFSGRAGRCRAAIDRSGRHRPARRHGLGAVSAR